jgi:hypothetical protein
MNKNFKLKAEEIKRLVSGVGACYATDMITVEGKKVGYMYREQDKTPSHSGWCFMSGTETQEYMDNPDNLSIYDVNTICNYDPEIIPFLDAPFNSAFARDSKTGKFVREKLQPMKE